MATHNQLGKTGENIAKKYFLDNGYEILAINWRYKYLEVDIIAKWQSVIVFCEVKTRNGNFFGLPEEAVTKRKRQHLLEAAENYLEINNLENEVRFDIISITFFSNNNYKVKHIEDAFSGFSY